MKIPLLIIIFLESCLVFGTISEVGIFKAGESIDLIQTCSNCTYINITSVTAPNSSIILSDAAMSRSGFRYNYTMPAQQSIGTYIVCGVGDLNGENSIWCYNFQVTQTGNKPTTAQGLIYFILLAISILIFILILYIGISTDGQRFEADSISGRIIGVNWKRYYKPACYIIAYAMATWGAYLGYEIANNFLESSSLVAFLHMIFVILLSLALPLMVFFIAMLTISFFTDKKALGLIERGLKP